MTNKDYEKMDPELWDAIHDEKNVRMIQSSLLLPKILLRRVFGLRKVQF